jgi:hypothetical protein
MNVINSQAELKSLQVQITKISAESEIMLKELRDRQKQYDTHINKLAHLKDKLTKLQKSHEEPIISEHAILRYLERVDGIDLETVKQKIMDEKTKSLVKFMGGNGKITREGFKIIVKNNTIITITD